MTIVHRFTTKKELHEDGEGADYRIERSGDQYTVWELPLFVPLGEYLGDAPKAPRWKRTFWRIKWAVTDHWWVGVLALVGGIIGGLL